MYIIATAIAQAIMKAGVPVAVIVVKVIVLSREKKEHNFYAFRNGYA